MCGLVAALLVLTAVVVAVHRPVAAVVRAALDGAAIAVVGIHLTVVLLAIGHIPRPAAVTVRIDAVLVGCALVAARRVTVKIRLGMATFIAMVGGHAVVVRCGLVMERSIGVGARSAAAGVTRFVEILVLVLLTVSHAVKPSKLDTRFSACAGATLCCTRPRGYIRSEWFRISVPVRRQRSSDRYWSGTPVGPIESWPASLLSTLRMVLYAPGPMFVWCGPQRIQFYNDAYIPHAGPRHPELIGQSGPVAWPEMWKIVGPQVDRVMAEGVPTMQDNALIPSFRNGHLEEEYWSYSYSPLFDETGIAGTLVVFAETTRAVIDSRRRLTLQALLERRAPTPSLEVAAASAFECLAQNPHDVPFAVAFREGQLIASTGPVLPVIVADDLPSLMAIAPMLVPPWPEPVTQVLVAKSRATFVFGVSPRITFDASYRAFFFELIAGIDASIDRAIADAAREAEDLQRENLYRHFIQAPFPIAVFRGPNHVVELANATALVAWGKSAVVMGKPLVEAIPELRDQPFLAWLDEVYATGASIERSEQFAQLATGPNGAIEDVYTNFAYSPLRGRKGEIEGVLSSAFIVTEQVRARLALEAALARAELSDQHRELALAEAERVNEAKDEFLATMSHELRTPLNAMLGWASLLRMAPHDAPKVARGLEVIERNAEAQARLISDLLDVSRIISGKLRLAVRETDVSAVIHAAIDVVRPAADAKAVRLVVELEPETGSNVADPDRLQQIVWNLLINAIKFTAATGSVTVSAKRIGSKMHVAVSDTGVGIAAEHLGAIFQRFRQIDGSTTRSHGGLGLGLAIVRHLVEGHGGTVAAESAGVGPRCNVHGAAPDPRGRQPRYHASIRRPRCEEGASGDRRRARGQAPADRR